jgi:hypothetical protein
MVVGLDELRKNCGFYEREWYTDSPDNHFCNMVYKSQNVFNKSKEHIIANGGHCRYEHCPIRAIMIKLGVD